MDRYATHQRALVGAVLRTTGPVLELGAGDYSTPLLHEICTAQNRMLITIEDDASWLARFKSLGSKAHAFGRSTLGASGWPAGFWNVVLVDHTPSDRATALRIFEDSLYLVVHDTEPTLNPTDYPGLQAALAGFRYRRDFRDVEPWTTVVSNTLPIWEDP